MSSLPVLRPGPRRARRRAAVRAVLLGTLVAVVGGSAFAYWSASGAGSGAGSTATVVAVTLSPGIAAPDLRPDGRADVVLTVTNTNGSSADIGSLVLDVAQGDVGFGVDAAHAGCNLTVLDYTTQTNADAGWTVPARTGAVDGTLAVTLPDAIGMSDEAADACQGADLTVYLTVAP